MRPPDPLTRPSSGWVDPSTGRRLPERIGRYRIVSRLGEGGMGVVFEAEQESPRRTVALKVLGTGALTEEMERRFAREAEVLGRLQHPGIAQVYEAGSFASEIGPQPFFAMELVRGEPLTRYADAQRLDTRTRIELVARIADAVQHAHERGVIHRDLKPGNVLVTADGQPKVLDFGVARATDSDVRQATLRTDLGQLLGTLAYMSPEQASGDPSKLDARSDVYSLGVVLYELLAGRLPYEVGGLAVPEAARVVRDEEARPISRLRRELAGDVETIAAKALEKDPARRYESAAALAADLRRFLVDQPILARPASAGYRLGKFARRNRVLVASMAGVFVALCVGLVGTSLGFLEARRQRDEARAAEERASAEERRASAEAVRATRTAAFLQSLLKGIDPAYAQGADTTLLRRILADTEARIASELADLPLVEAEIRTTIGLTYEALGDSEAALVHLRAGLALYERELGPEASNTITSRANVAGALRHVGGSQAAMAEMRATSALAHRVLGDEQRVTLMIDNSLATLLYEGGDYEAAHELAARTLPLLRRVSGDDAPETLNAMATLGTSLLQRAQWEEAETLLAELRERSERVRGPDHPQTIKILNNLSGLLLQRGRMEESVALQREACERSARVNGAAHPLTLQLVSVLGSDLANAGRWDEAEATQRAALDACLRANGPDHHLTLDIQSTLASLLRERGRFGEAEALYRVVLASAERSGLEPVLRRKATLGLGMTCSALKRYQEAESLLREALAMVGALPVADGSPHEPAAGEAAFDPGEWHAFQDALSALGALQLAQSRYPEAEATFRRALEFVRERFGGGDRGFANLQSGLGLALMNQHRFEEAEQLLRSAIEQQTRVLGPDHADTLTSVFNLGGCLWWAGKPDEALPLVMQAAAGWSARGGDQHPSSVRTREMLFDLFGELDRPVEEEPWRRKDLALARERLASDDPALGEPLAALARTLLAQGKLEEAWALLEEALRVQGPLALEDWRVSWTNVLLGGVLAAQGQADQAAALWEGSEAGLRGAPQPVQRWARGIVAAAPPGSSGG